MEMKLTAGKNMLREPGDIVSVAELLTLDSLAIPQYQRPYKWQVSHVVQMLEDIAQNQNMQAYRLGTVVLHRAETAASLTTASLNIVDGQQRTITLMLIVLAVIESDKEQLRQYVESIPRLSKVTERFTFSNKISCHNIRANYQEISRLVRRSDFDLALLNFLLNKCEVVVFTLTDVSEAFQFFDAQNARGKDLAPHDLLKAFHLREFSERDRELKAQAIAHWESCDDLELTRLFSQYLSRIRRWAKGQRAVDFNKADVALFKGVSFGARPTPPYAWALQIADNSVDRCNTGAALRAHDQSLNFPFQLDQTIINGRRFFEMIQYYQQQNFHSTGSNRGTSAIRNILEKDSRADQILDTLDSYPSRGNRGDVYVRNMFDCLLMYYSDRFALTDKAMLSKVLEVAFVWAYWLRLENQRVRRVSVEGYIMKKNLFQVLRDASDARELLVFDLSYVKLDSGMSDKAKHSEILQLFKKMGYASGS